MLVGLLVAVWMDGLLRRVGRADLVSIGGDAVPYLLAMVSAGTVGAVLASRRPRHPVGWLLLAIALSVIVLGMSDAYAAYGLLARPGSLPGATWAAVYVNESWVVLSTLLGFVLLLTPTGSLPSTRWRWWARLVVAAAVAAAVLNTQPLDPPYQAVAVQFLVPDGPLAALATLGTFITLLGLLVAAGSLVGRFRRARGIERLQLRWVTMAAALAGLAAAVILATWATIGNAAQPLWEWVTGAYLVALPLATGASILRYRLYDLDRIISRTLAYALLTLVLSAPATPPPPWPSASCWAGTPAWPWPGPPWPWPPPSSRPHGGSRQVVDRRFNRRRYDAARTIAAFSARLREQVDLDTLSAELLAVTGQTMQPTTATLWLRPLP